MTHIMTLLYTRDDGEHWLCLECGREFVIVSYEPWKRHILEPGDETVAHTGGRGITFYGVEVIA